MEPSNRRLLLLEANEIPLCIFRRYAARNPSSSIAKMFNEGIVYETFAEDEGHLHPWSTWPTVHRGIHNRMHGLKDFGQDLDKLDRKYPPLWKLLQQSGLSVGVFGSLHADPLPSNAKDYAFYCPGPFAAKDEAHPPELRAFQAFNLSMSRRAARTGTSRLDFERLLPLLPKLPRLGVRSSTLSRIARHLAEERFQPWKQCRRRIFQSTLGFDIFFHQWKTKKPDFATFFTNHVAATMHRFWAATYPEHYDPMPEPWWIQTYGEEIDFAMHELERCIGILWPLLAAHDTTLVVTSSMGQSPTSVKRFYSELSLDDPARLLATFSIPSSAFSMQPAMHPQYNLRVEEAWVSTLHQGLLSLTIKNQKVSFRAKEGGFFSIDLGQPDLKPGDVRLRGQFASLESLGLAVVPSEGVLGETAYHVPEGSLLIAHPGSQMARVGDRLTVSTRAIAPSILEYFGHQVPKYMVSQRINELCLLDEAPQAAAA